MARMTGRQAIMEVFRNERVRYVFGNPGTTEIPLLDALQDEPGTEYILCLHEGVALGIAQMYATASGKTGVVNLHVAPGVGNALGMLYNAWVGKAPMVVTAGQQDSRMLLREPVLAHDLVSMAKPLTKWAVQLQHVEEIPVLLPRVFKVAQDPPRGPVFLSLPSNVLGQEADLDIPGPTATYRRNRPDPAGVAAAAEVLARAANPAIVCGDGVGAAEAVEELVRFAEALGAPVWNTVLMAQMNFPFSHPQFRSELPGEYPAIRRLLGEPDVVVAVGADLFHEVFYSEASPFPEGCALVHLDSSPWEIGKSLPAAVGLLADLKLGLPDLTEALVARMDGGARARAAERRTAMAEQKKAEQERQLQRAEKTRDASPVTPARLMDVLRECLPQDVVIYSEAITASADVVRSLPFERPKSFFGNQGGGIGQALPGALGIQLALPDRPVVAVVGDGSSMYTIRSLWTAAHHGIPVVYVILSNQSYRILKFNMNRYRRATRAAGGKPYPAMDLADPALDFVSIARGMGVQGRRITRPDEIRPAALEALASKAPFVLEVATEGSVPAE
jgi:benzoylformate decarboxylase